MEGKALTFLQRRGVISTELQFRIMKLQRDGSGDPFFKCPAGCGRLLVDSKARADVHTDKRNELAVTVVVERCPCGAGVCVQCHKHVGDDKMERHDCPAIAAIAAAEEALSLKLLDKVAKKCPRCGMYVQKNGGCDYMMCGTHTHGNLRDAIRNGGCGHSFKWSDLKPVTTFFHNHKGESVNGDPAAMYPEEIKQLKIEFGLAIAEEGPGSDGGSSISGDAS